MNTSGYLFTDKVRTHKFPFINNETGLLEVQEKKGLILFGEQTGVLTEDKLTPGIVDYILSKKDEKGQSIYKDHLVKDKA